MKLTLRFRFCSHSAFTSSQTLRGDVGVSKTTLRELTVANGRKRESSASEKAV